MALDVMPTSRFEFAISSIFSKLSEPYCAHQLSVRLHSTLHDLPIKTLGRIDVELESEGGLQEAFTITE